MDFYEFLMLPWYIEVFSVLGFFLFSSILIILGIKFLIFIDDLIDTISYVKKLKEKEEKNKKMKKKGK